MLVEQTKCYDDEMKIKSGEQNCTDTQNKKKM